MLPDDTATTRRWFVLNYIPPLPSAKPQRYVDDFNRDNPAGALELFAPKLRQARLVAGRVQYVEHNLTYHYLFVRGSFSHVKQLCAAPHNGFSFMLNPLSHDRYATVTDRAMESFRLVSRLYSNTLPFYDLTDIDLLEGDTVEIVDGEYAGLQGTFMPRARSNRGNLVIAATASLGTILWNVDARYVRILSFARDTRRQYDILSSFIPRLYPVLRHHHDGLMLTPREVSLLSVFNRRMQVVVPENPKLEAKLLATLLCVQYLLGDHVAYAATQKRFQSKQAALTNPDTRALTTLLLAVSTGNLSPLHAAYTELLNDPRPGTATRRQLIAEYQHYLDNS